MSKIEVTYFFLEHGVLDGAVGHITASVPVSPAVCTSKALFQLQVLHVTHIILL